MEILNKEGRLPPAFISVIIISAFMGGNVTGWIAHVNWSLRGEADQLVEDARVVNEIHRDTDTNLIALSKRIEDSRNETLDDCFRTRSPSGYFTRLRGKGTETRQPAN